MLAYKWGLKTVYYSLINKVGAKEGVTATATQVLAEPITIYEALDDEDCAACKL
jgi:hypothetical protein